MQHTYLQVKKLPIQIYFLSLSNCTQLYVVIPLVNILWELNLSRDWDSGKSNLENITRIKVSCPKRLVLAGTFSITVAKTPNETNCRSLGGSRRKLRFAVKRGFGEQKRIALKRRKWGWIVFDTARRKEEDVNMKRRLKKTRSTSQLDCSLGNHSVQSHPIRMTAVWRNRHKKGTFLSKPSGLRQNTGDVDEATSP